MKEEEEDDDDDVLMEMKTFLMGSWEVREKRGPFQVMTALISIIRRRKYLSEGYERLKSTP